MMDRYSVDNQIHGFSTQGGLKREDLFLKEIPSSHPLAKRYEDIPCVIIRSEIVADRSALICLHEQGTMAVESLPWIRQTASKGVVIVGIDASKKDPLGKRVAKILSGMTYLALRLEIVDPECICFWGEGEPGVWAFLASVLDERVAGLILDSVPFEIATALLIQSYSRL
jgi:hypothetical protein